MASHYAPTLPVRLDATSVADDEALLAFGPPLPGGRRQFPAQQVRQQHRSRGLFVRGAAAARCGTASRSGASRIAVMPIPESGLGAAINDRLRRAAAPRDPQRLREH